MKPSIGRIVHYVARGSADGVFKPEHRAAIITEVVAAPDGDGAVVGLCIINPTGLFFHPVSAGACPPYDEAGAPGTWHWPERIEG